MIYLAPTPEERKAIQDDLIPILTSAEGRPPTAGELARAIPIFLDVARNPEIAWELPVDELEALAKKLGWKKRRDLKIVR